MEFVFKATSIQDSDPESFIISSLLPEESVDSVLVMNNKRINDIRGVHCYIERDKLYIHKIDDVRCSSK